MKKAPTLQSLFACLSSGSTLQSGGSRASAGTAVDGRLLSVLSSSSAHNVSISSRSPPPVSLHSAALLHCNPVYMVHLKGFLSLFLTLVHGLATPHCVLSHPFLPPASLLQIRLCLAFPNAYLTYMALRSLWRCMEGWFKKEATTTSMGARMGRERT